MQGRHTKPTIAPATAPRLGLVTGAITWITRDRALVARRSRAGEIDVMAVESRDDGETYLARVAHTIGDRDRVLIVGPDALRVELEREYVAIYQRPDRLVDVEPAGELSEAALVARLRELSA